MPRSLVALAILVVTAVGLPSAAAGPTCVVQDGTSACTVDSTSDQGDCKGDEYATDCFRSVVREEGLDIASDGGHVRVVRTEEIHHASHDEYRLGGDCPERQATSSETSRAVRYGAEVPAAGMKAGGRVAYGESASTSSVRCGDLRNEEHRRAAFVGADGALTVAGFAAFHDAAVEEVRHDRYRHELTPGPVGPCDPGAVCPPPPGTSMSSSCASAVRTGAGVSAPDGVSGGIGWGTEGGYPIEPLGLCGHDVLYNCMFNPVGGCPWYLFFTVLERTGMDL